MMANEDSEEYRWMKELAFPRMMGSEGERKAKEWITKKLEELEIGYHKEEFLYSKFSYKRYLYISLILIMLYLDIIEKYSQIIALISFIIILAIAFYFVRQMFAFKLPIPHMELKGENIVGELLTGGTDKDNKEPKGDQEGPKSDQRIILLSAHYDSISTRFRVPVLKMLLIPAGLALLLFLLLYLITLVLELFHFSISSNLLVIFKYVYIVLSAIVSAILIIMLFDRKENKSPGACDNATGVAIILKIAQIIKDRLQKGEFSKDKEGIHFIFLFTAGEELGLFGSRAYLKEHNKSLSMVKDKFYQINVDMVGSEIAYLGKASLFSNKPPNRFLNKALERCAEKNKIETRSFKSMFGSSSDHAPFMNEKFESFLFCSTHDDQIHSKNDTPEKINPQKMKEAVKLIECMIDMIRQEDNLGK